MTTIHDDMDRVLVGLEEQGCRVRKAKLGFRITFPDGSSTTMSPTGDRRTVQNQRAVIRRHGLRWPLDPEPKQKRPRAATRAPEPKVVTPPPARQHETERKMAATKDIEYIDVTPEMAEKWLEKNSKNRKLSDRVVTRYAQMMSNDQWHYDASPLRFDTDDNVLDGQHRLWALVESGTTQKFLVVRGLDPRSFVTIDTGKTRSFGDIISIERPGLRNVHHLAAVTAMLWRWNQGYRGKQLRATGNVPAAPPETLLNLFESREEEIVELYHSAQAVARKVPGLGATIISLLMSIFNQIDADDAEFFFDRLMDGAGLEAGNPILALRNNLLKFASTRDRRTNLPTEVGVALGIKAWNAYRRGDDIHILNYRVGGARPEQFPTAE